MIYFWLVIIELLIANLEITFVSDCFLSRLAKYLLFFGMFNYVSSAFDCMNNPFNVVSVVDFHYDNYAFIS